MKWPVLGFILCLATISEQKVLKCTPGVKNIPCEVSIEQRIGTDANSTERPLVEKALPVQCLAGSEWKSNCHQCKCSADGRAKCVKTDTCNKPIAEPISCKPNTTFVTGDKTCDCLHQGMLHCTITNSTSYTEADFPIGKDCSPGSHWKNQCNECVCSPDGLRSCTEKACPGQENKSESKCETGTKWKDECNVCWCIGGVPLCTRLGCSGIAVSDFNPEGDDKNNEDKKVKMDDEKIHFKSYDANEIPNEIDNHNLVKRNPAELICKPNLSFKIDCNFCDCDAEGLSYSCTDDECMEDIINKDVEVFMEAEEGVDHAERHSVCKPRTTFYVTCNLCRCNSDGTDYTCTNKPCPLPKDVELFHELRPTRLGGTENVTKAVVCPANRMFVKDCNTCLCSEDGTSYVCTRKVCVDLEDEFEKKDETKRKCKPNEIFVLDCNTCRCDADGKSFSCTRRACPDEKDLTQMAHARKIRSPQQETPKNCQPGQEFRMDCNKCLCDNEGQNYSCTRIDCTALSNNNGGTRTKREISSQMKAECVPGSEFRQRCNVCRCTADGAHATCSAKRCKDDDAAVEPDSAASFRCNPGEQFKRGCNDCTCSADGKDVFCTLRLCEQDITNI